MSDASNPNNSFSSGGPSSAASSEVLAELKSLRAANKALGGALKIGLLGALFLSAGMGGFILRETILLRRQNGEMRNFVQEYERVNVPKTEEFTKRLIAFGRTSPEFNALLARHLGSTNVAAPAPAPAPASGPKAAPF